MCNNMLRSFNYDLYIYIYILAVMSVVFGLWIFHLKKINY